MIIFRDRQECADLCFSVGIIKTEQTDCHYQSVHCKFEHLLHGYWEWNQQVDYEVLLLPCESSIFCDSRNPAYGQKSAACNFFKIGRKSTDFKTAEVVYIVHLV